MSKILEVEHRNNFRVNYGRPERLLAVYIYINVHCSEFHIFKY